MRLFSTVVTLALGFCLSNAQYTLNNDGSISCSTAGGAYCAGASLTTNIIIRCSNFVGGAGNCNDNIAFALPPGSGASALCWESSTTSGDAACSFNGTAYGINGSFPIPSSSGTSTTTPAPYSNATVSSTTSGSQNSSTVISVGPGSTTTGPGFSITGGSSASTVTTVVPAPTVTGSGSSGSGSGSSSAGSGSSASATLAGSDASGLTNTAGMGIVASILAGLLALGMI